MKMSGPGQLISVTDKECKELSLKSSRMFGDNILCSSDTMISCTTQSGMGDLWVDEKDNLMVRI